MSNETNGPVRKPIHFWEGPRWSFVVVSIFLFLFFLLMYLPSFRERMRDRAGLYDCRNNLEQIGLALHYYLDQYDGSFPPAYIADENGRPIHSWRMLLLPFLEQQELYDKYNFDEPWDGPNNSKLGEPLRRNRPGIGRRIYGYLCPEDDGPEEETNYLAVVGGNTAWPGTTGKKYRDFKDGASVTIIIVEVTNSGIHWMEPRDLRFDEMPFDINPKNALGISSPHGSGAHILVANGSVSFLNEKFSPETLRRLMIIDDGEPVDEFWRLNE